MPTRIVLRTTSLPSKASNSSATSTCVVNRDEVLPVRIASLAYGFREVTNSKNPCNICDTVTLQTPNEDPPSSTVEYVSTPPRSNTTASAVQKQQVPRSVLNFRSSILREQLQSTSESSKFITGVHGAQVDDNATILRPAASSTFPQALALAASTQAPSPSPKVRLSKDDIRASPRLTGYLFTMIAAAVLLTSVVKFYKSLGPIPESEIIITQHGAFVFKWKLYGAIFVSAIGCLLSFLTVVAHFDTVLLPFLWIYMFRDGSLAERNWICFLIVYWAISVHICTSTLSVGELQPNVFFTTWIAFWIIASTFDVWRESTGLTSSLTSANLSAKKTLSLSNNNNSDNQQSDQQNNNVSLPGESLPATVSEPPDSSFHRETTINWIWTLAFSLLFALSIVDVYYNRNHLKISFNASNPELLDQKDWTQVLSTVWTDVVVCVLAIFFNEIADTSVNETGATLSPVFARNRQTGVKNKCVFSWRKLEGFVICCASAFKFYIILAHTGVDGVINGLSNAYFGIWGSFFNSIFTFGTWLREKRNEENVVRENISQSCE